MMSIQETLRFRSRLAVVFQLSPYLKALEHRAETGLMGSSLAN